MKKNRGIVVALIAAMFLATMLWSFPFGSSAASKGSKAKIGRVQDEVFTRVIVRSEADRQRARQIGEIVEDYGSYVLVSSSRQNLTISRKAAKDLQLDAVELDTVISLRSGSFDPLSQENPAALYRAEGGYQEAIASGDYHIVQFIGPVRDEWLRDITATGAEVIQYVPHQAFLVYANADQMQKISAHPRVRWNGRYQPAFKISSDLGWVYGEEVKADPTRTTAAFGKDEIATYDVAVFSRANLDSVKNQVSSFGAETVATSVLPNNYFNVLRVKMAPSTVKSVLGLRDVIAVDPYIPPTREDERAAHIIAGNYTSGTVISGPGYNPGTQFGVTGMNVTVGVVDDGVGIPGDGGFYVTAANTVNGPLRGASAGAQGHGHLQASIIAGTTPFSTLDPTGHNYGLGVAPNSNIVNIPLLRTGYTGTDADAQNDAVVTAGPNGVRANITNNSFGAGLNGNAYDSLAAQYDGFVRDASAAPSIDPLCIIFSAGNQGASGLTRPKVAKNVIATASSENLRTELDATANNLEDVSSFSSRGLAADGRIKPDLTAPGQAISGGRSGPDALFGNIDAAHRWSSGTSHAAPQVAGAAALITHAWKNANGGNNPSPAMIKAQLINSTVDMTGTGATAARPNNAEGWGRIKINNILNTGVPISFIDQTHPLSNVGQVYTFTGTVANPAQPLRVTLVWTDPPAVSDPALVNNLDLEVNVNSNLYRGNVLSGGLSVTGGTADTLNNIENVFLPAGSTGSISVTVRATALNGDGILGNGDTTDQHFALMIFNVNPASLPVISPNGASIVTEGCTPTNGAPDPGESLTVDLSIINSGTASTGPNVIGTLQATGGVINPGPAQNFGVLAPGASSTRTFSFDVDPMVTCGSDITLTLNLTGGFTGTVSYTFTTGTLAPGGPFTFSNTANISIPSSGAASPYPSNITVSGITGTVTKVTVSLNQFNHTFPDDVDVLLVGPTGAKVVIFSDVGGSTDAINLNFTLDDTAASPLPDSGPLVSGTFRPTNIGATDTFPAPAPPSPYGSMLSTFNGLNPNGTWSLFVVDDLGGDSGNFAGGWSITFLTNDPVCTSPCAPGGGGAALEHQSVYVADTNNNRVQRSTDDGATWEQIGLGSGVTLGRFTKPRGVAASGDDQIIFVADTGNNRIQRSTDGGATWSLLNTGPGPSTIVGRINGAQGIAYDEVNDILYVADTGNNRIQSVTGASTGSPAWALMTGTGFGSALGKFNQPRGIAVDLTGNVYVADTGNNRIQFYDGSVWSIFASATFGSAVGKVNGPRGIFVNDDGVVYVADTNNNRIQFYNGAWAVFNSSASSKPEGVTQNSNDFVFFSHTALNTVMRRPADMSTAATIVGPSGTLIGRFQGPTGVR